MRCEKWQNDLVAMDCNVRLKNCDLITQFNDYRLSVRKTVCCIVHRASGIFRRITANTIRECQHIEVEITITPGEIVRLKNSLTSKPTRRGYHRRPGERYRGAARNLNVREMAWLVRASLPLQTLPVHGEQVYISRHHIRLAGLLQVCELRSPCSRLGAPPDARDPGSQPVGASRHASIRYRLKQDGTDRHG